MDLSTNSNYFHLQHEMIGFITEIKSVYNAVRTGSLNKAVCASSLEGYYRPGVSSHRYVGKHYGMVTDGQPRFTCHSFVV